MIFRSHLVLELASCVRFLTSLKMCDDFYKCFVLGRFYLAIECGLLDIYPISVLFLNITKKTKTKTKQKKPKQKSIKAGCDIKFTTVLIKINAKLCV